MATIRQREIVIELEQVRLIRKRAKTDLLFCERCGKENDFVSQFAAASLFEISAETLWDFVAANNIHTTFAISDGGVCVTSLLEKMQTLQKLRTGNKNTLVAMGETNVEE